MNTIHHIQFPVFFLSPVLKRHLFIRVLVLILLLTGFSGFGQEFNGEYVMTNTMGGENTAVFNFNEDQTFTEVTYHNFNLNSRKEGRYTLINDILTLNYQNPVKSMLVVREKKRITPVTDSTNTLTNIFIKLHNKAVNEPGTSMIHFKGADDGYFMATPIPDTYAVTLYNDQLKSAVISALGDHDVEIDLDPLIGYSATLDINYSKTKYLKVSPVQQQYNIEILESGALKLIPLQKGSPPFIIEKVQPE